MNFVTFLGREITRQQVIDAFNHFDSQYPDTNSYDSWINKRTYKYAIRYNSKLYPCKFILKTFGWEQTLREKYGIEK